MEGDRAPDAGLLFNDALAILKVFDIKYLCDRQVVVTEGQTVRWLMAGMGTFNDMHTPVFVNQVCCSITWANPAVCCLSWPRLFLSGLRFFVLCSQILYCL